jgi:hypothetical protein
MHETDLTNADVIFYMLVENTYNMRSLYRQKIKNGTRLIKHDLPLLGPERLITLFTGCHFRLKKQEAKVNGPHRYSEKKMQVHALQPIQGVSYLAQYRYGNQVTIPLHKLGRLRMTQLSSFIASPDFFLNSSNQLTHYMLLAKCARYYDFTSPLRYRTTRQ